LASKLS